MVGLGDEIAAVGRAGTRGEMRAGGMSNFAQKSLCILRI